MFITFEGPEGGGKTTQALRLSERLRAAGRRCTLTREPGGTELGDSIRSILLHQGDVAISARSEALLYCAARAQVVEQVIRPALVAGQVVVADRYADSTLAYQGYGRQLDVAVLSDVLAFATGGLRPDLTILLDVPVNEGLRRKRLLPGIEWNRFEQESVAYHRRVRDGFLDLAAQEPRRWVVIDAQRSLESVEQEVWEAVDSRLGGVVGSRAAGREPR